MNKTHFSGQWSNNPETAITQAIERFSLQRLGWRNFEQLDWVQELHRKYKLLREIALKTSLISGVMLEDLSNVLQEAGHKDRQLVQSYFIAKLALEELSCRLNGAGAGSCDKKAAFLQIFSFLNQAQAA